MNAKRSTLRTQARAVLLTEAVVSLAIVGLVLVATTLLVADYARSTDYLLNCRRVQLAAEAAAERLRATGTCRPAPDNLGPFIPLRDDSFTDETGISYEVQIQSAKGAWAPLNMINITATVTGRGGRVASHELRTYVSGAEAERGGSE